MGQTFQVLTEFKFDATNAVAESKVLKSAVDGVSSAADGALNSLKGLGLGAVSALGLGSFLGTLKSAVDTSDKFHASVLDFSTVIATNMQYLQGATGSFNERLAATRSIMSDITATAEKMNLQQGDLFSVVKAVVPTLAPHGAAGDNFKNAIGLSSQALNAGANIGMGTTDVASQLKSILGGSGESGGLLGRLLGTSALKGAGGADGLNAMAFKDRLKLVQAGLNELGSDMGMLAERSNLLSVQLDKLKMAFFGDANGMGSILKPLGDVLRGPLVDMLKGVNSYLKTEGAQIVGNMSQLVKSMVKKPQDMIVDLMQLRHLRGDLGKAKDTLQAVGVVTGVGHALKFLTGNAMFANPAIGALAGSFMFLRDMAQRMNDPISKMVSQFFMVTAGVGLVSAVLIKFGIFWQVLGFILGEVLIPLGFLTAMFQSLSRAQAKAQVEDAETLLRLAPKITELMTRVKMAFSNLIAPITDMIEGWSEIFKPFFKWGSIVEFCLPLLETLVSLFEDLGIAVVSIMGVISGMIMMLYQIVDNAVHFRNPLKDTQQAFTNGFDDYLKTHLQKMDKGENVSNKITNIGKVEIKNDFKETQEPDRIAFTMKDQLLKAAQNPTQSKGRSLQLAFGSN